MTAVLAVKCVRRECARLTLHDGEPPEFCPHCTSRVEPFPLRHPEPEWKRR